MKRAFVLLAVCSLAACLCSCRTRDFRTQTIRVPAMKNAACAKLIRAAFAEQERQSGMAGSILMDKLRFDLTNHTVTVTYDSMTLALKNLEFFIAKAGFPANEIPADANALKALPADCR